MSTKQIKNLICLKRLLPYKPRKREILYFSWFTHSLMQTQIAFSERNRNPKCKALQEIDYFAAWHCFGKK